MKNEAFSVTANLQHGSGLSVALSSGPSAKARFMMGVGAVLMLALLLLPCRVMANPAIEQFETFVRTVPAAAGTFLQSTVGPDGQPSRQQQGRFSFARPGKFRWDIDKPFVQQVVSDGKTLFQYDPDLLQMTVRALGSSIGSSPAAILFGQGDLDDSFEIKPLPDADGMYWLRATPRQPDSGLSQVDIGLMQGRPARMLLLDGFGQTTRVDLLTIRAQSGFAPGEFKIDPPVGTDVVRIE